MKFLINLIVAVFIASGGLIASAKASIVAFEWDEGSPGINSAHTSRHGSLGPVLADDFNPDVGGLVHSITWWGSSASSNQWEITFHSDTTNAGGWNEPAFTLPRGGLSQHFLTASGADSDGDQVFEYTALWTPQDMVLAAGTTYWFSVANFSSGWTWALTDGVAPGVGTQSHAPTRSVGGSHPGGILGISGPHDGPWTALADGSNFAFRVNVVPVPAAVWLFGSALIGFVGLSRRRKLS